jgi:nitrous oxidase accessory protein NosD
MVVFTILFFLSISSLVIIPSSTSQVQRTTIFIQSDGSVSPQNIPIQRDGSVYTFSDNVYDPILIQKSNVTLNGAGYSLIGPLTAKDIKAEQVLGFGPNTTIQVQYIIGVDFDKNVSGVTIKNLNIGNFSIGVYIRTTQNILLSNGVEDNVVGVLLSGSANAISKNYIANNKEGLFFGFEQKNHNADNIPSDIKISENSFINNSIQFSGCVCKVYNFSETKHSWDDGKKGNYWSNYNGTDVDHDGLGDTPYVIDVLNQDRYPLTQSVAFPPAVKASLSVWPMILVIALTIIVAVLALVFLSRRRKKL